jgi:hypothetical protein
MVHDSKPSKISIETAKYIKIEASEFNKDLKRAFKNIMGHMGFVPIGGYRNSTDMFNLNKFSNVQLTFFYEKPD